MGEIYTKCSRTYCWLGCDLTALGDPFEFFRVMAHEGVQNSFTSEDLERPAIIFSSEWWTRIWTYQEAALPTTIQLVWGHYQLTWAVLLRSLEQYFSGLRARPSDQLGELNMGD